MKKVALRFLTLSLVVYILILSFFDYVIPKELFLITGFLILGQFINYIFKKHLTIYVMKRIIGTILTLFVVATVTFLLLRTLPGGPFDEAKSLPPEVKKSIEKKYKLNEPLSTQYYDFMAGLLKGDVGTSYKYIDRPIFDIIWDSFLISLQLGVYALIFSFLIGIPMGLIAASNYNTAKDRSIMIVAISGISLPNFLLASILILIFCFTLEWFPVAFWEGPQYYVLPMIVLGVRSAALVARLTRSSVLDVMNEDYIRTARAKGLSENRVRYQHVLKNSLLPVLTSSGPIIAGVLTGSFVIELIFAIPGLGKHFVQSVTNRDYPLVLAVTLLYSFILVVSNLIVDLLYSYFDPRIELT